MRKEGYREGFLPFWIWMKKNVKSYENATKKLLIIAYLVKAWAQKLALRNNFKALYFFKHKINKSNIISGFLQIKILTSIYIYIYIYIWWMWV
jgi:hypothetical protein